jgi:hypothetical protein
MVVLNPGLAKWVVDTRMERRSAVHVPGLMRLQPGRKNPQSGSKETGRRAIRWWSSKPIDRAELLRTQVRTQSSIRYGVTCRGPWQHTRRERRTSRGANAVNGFGAALAFSTMDHQKLALFDASLCSCLGVSSNHLLRLIHLRLTLNRARARKNRTKERKKIRRTE